MKKYSFILLGILLAVGSCQRSDICTEDIPATPKLVIKFYDAQKPHTLKPVINFNVKALHSDSVYFEEPINDTVVALPLRTHKDFTTYAFIIHQKDSLAPSITDTLKFSYTSDEMYISRACGFKSIFLNLNVQQLDSAAHKNWVKQIVIRQPDTISNERTAHLYIYH